MSYNPSSEMRVTMPGRTWGKLVQSELIIDGEGTKGVSH
jgi:hypothetical protein